MFVPISSQTAPKGKRLKCDSSVHVAGAESFFDERFRRRSICERTCVSERSMQRSPPEICLSEVSQVYSRRDVPAYNPQKYEPKRELRERRHIELTHRDRACTHQTRYPGAAAIPHRPSLPRHRAIIFSLKRFLPEKRSRHAYTYTLARMRKICIERFVRNALQKLIVRIPKYVIS